MTAARETGAWIVTLCAGVALACLVVGFSLLWFNHIGVELSKRNVVKNRNNAIAQVYSTCRKRARIGVLNDPYCPRP